MLVIRNNQFHQVEEYLEIRFINRVLTHLQAQFPEVIKNYDDESLVLTIKKGIAAADKYAIHKPADVIRFLELYFYFGNDFDNKPPMNLVKKILRTRNYSGTDKMDRIAGLNLLQYNRDGK